MFRSFFILIFLIFITFSDIRCYKIPDVLVFSLMLFLLSYDIGHAFELTFYNILCAVFFFAIFYVLYRCTKGIGFGDVKLITVLSYGLGFFNLVFIISISALLGLAYFAVNVNKSIRRIPFAPFLLLGFLLLKFKDFFVYVFM